MKHLIVCREYPPAPGGGIGVYAARLSRLLAEVGETVHVIGQLWANAESRLEEDCQGRLIIHRLPYDDWASLIPRQPHPSLKGDIERSLFASSFSAQCFSWEAALLAEKIVDEEGIDIIEAQDYEAPLYYFQLRRALGMGPSRKPPCFVHLHSPTQLIARHNDFDLTAPEVLIARRLEAYSVASADRLLSPSRYLASQVESVYGLPQGAIKVIPYPIGDSCLLEREKETWESGSLCYVGRLEKRKGVIELVQAGVAVAGEYPEVRFEFVGADTFDSEKRSVRELLDKSIPRKMKRNFRFHGPLRGTAMSRVLKQARLAVIPSRWENFPNTCIEAMASGLPIIASREGGMTEMIEHGRTGWLTRNPGSEGIAQCLRQVLTTSPTRIEEFGHRAASTIRELCDNERVIAQHLEFRRAIVDQGAKHSMTLPANLPWSNGTLADQSPRRVARSSFSQGIAMVVVSAGGRASLTRCLRSIRSQVRSPFSAVIVPVCKQGRQARKELAAAQREGWKVVPQMAADTSEAKQAGIETVLASGFQPLGLCFVDASTWLEPDFVATCESVLKRHPEVGIVSGWALHRNGNRRVWSNPCPSFPCQWLVNEAAPFSVVRTESLLEVRSSRENNNDFEDWEVFNAIMAAGWVAVTVPDVLAHFSGEAGRDSGIRPTPNGTSAARRMEMFERYPDLAARDAQDLALLAAGAESRSLRWSFPMREQLAIVRVMLRYPRTNVPPVFGRLKNLALRHTPVWVSGFISRLGT